MGKHCMISKNASSKHGFHYIHIGCIPHAMDTGQLIPYLDFSENNNPFIQAMVLKAKQ